MWSLSSRKDCTSLGAILLKWIISARGGMFVAHLWGIGGSVIRFKILYKTWRGVLLPQQHATTFLGWEKVIMMRNIGINFRTSLQITLWWTWMIFEKKSVEANKSLFSNTKKKKGGKLSRVVFAGRSHCINVTVRQTSLNGNVALRDLQR